MDAGIENRNNAMRQVDLAANDEWKQAAAAVVRAVCKVKHRFNADDIFEILDKLNVSTHENRALGPIMARAQRDGLCRKVTTYPEFTKSRRPQLHKTPLQNWESLTCIVPLQSEAHSEITET